MGQNWLCSTVHSRASLWELRELEVLVVQVTERTRVRTHPERAVPDEAESILERGMVAHVGFVVDGQPLVIPMGYYYEQGKIYIHGQRQGRLPRFLRSGEPVCVEVTLLEE